MHRDISTGNILIWEGKGILTDFEYAKRIPPKGSVSTTSHEGRAVRELAFDDFIIA